MIVSNKHRYVYIRIPKTGTKSMSEFLVRHYGGRKARYAPYHSSRVPARYKDHFVFTVVRNPYERIWSKYWFEWRSERAEHWSDIEDKSFGNYLQCHIKWAEEGTPYGLSPEACMNQGQYCQQAGVKKFIRLEGLDTEIKEANERERHRSKGGLLGSR